MKKSIILFVTAAVLSAEIIVYGWMFAGGLISEAVLTEETVTGDRNAAGGLTAGFRADSGDDLHWFNSFDYDSGESASTFKRGEILETTESSIYDDVQKDTTFGGRGDLTKTVKTVLYEDIRFNGWSVTPFVTKLSYDKLEGLQEKKIHDFYDEIQKNAVKSGDEEKGRIKLKDYLDYYPVSFRFQLGTNRYDSDNALTGLKIYDEQGSLSAENGAAYDEDVELYNSFNEMFRIPVIDNEYHQYKVSPSEDYDPETALGYATDVKKLSGAGEDYYQFDPIMVKQEGNDKNRILFIVNNKTAKGASVDVSQIRGGYGIYELPIEEGAATMKVGPRTVTVPDPTPLPEQMAMVYPLDETAEYVELSLSDDFRYLAVFSVKDGAYSVEMIDADTWVSNGSTELFPASEKMAYSWGDDGSLAITNHEGYAAALCRAENGSYELIYSGRIEDDFDKAFFGSEMVHKKNSYAKYQYGIDEGLALVSKDGKIAMAQNPLPENDKGGARTAELECAVMDAGGIIYRGVLKSNITEGVVPVENKNWIKWQ